jgi:glycosyltransferase involved in cell wall biosynthesis
MVSIIIPVYQARDTLRKCVGSCLSQKEISPSEYEIILVDDGSNDGSDVICDELSGSRTGVIVRAIHTENHGVSHARNEGIGLAKGRFIVFVDSDDEVTDAFLSNLIKHADEATMLVDETKSFNSVQKISGYQYIENSILNENTHVWGKLIDRKSLIEGNIRFAEGVAIGEDLLFMLDLALFADKRHCIRCIPEGNYIYNDNDKGAMNSALKESYLDQILCWRRTEEKLLAVKENISPYAFVSVAVSQILTALLVIGKVATQTGERDEALDKKAMTESMEQIGHALKVRGAFAALPTGHKIKVMLLKFNPDLYLKMYARHKGDEYGS